jgi:integrase
VFVYTLRHKSIVSDPIAEAAFSANSAKRRNRRHHPLTAEQVTAIAERRFVVPGVRVADVVRRLHGLRAEEIAGCEVDDFVFNLQRGNRSQPFTHPVLGIDGMRRDARAEPVGLI